MIQAIADLLLRITGLGDGDQQGQEGADPRTDCPEQRDWRRLSSRQPSSGSRASGTVVPVMVAASALAASGLIFSR